MPHPDKRAALSLLTVKRLGGLCDAFELDRAAGARKDDLVELLARSKRASFEAILGQLKRDELKDICGTISSALGFAAMREVRQSGKGI